MIYGIIEGKKTAATGSGQNLTIGGASALVPDVATLASKLGITENYISEFEISGTDVKARVTAIYSPTWRAFASGSVTSFIDYGNLMTSASTQIFYQASNLIYARLNGLKEITNSLFSYATKLERAELNAAEKILSEYAFNGVAIPEILLPKLVSTAPRGFAQYQTTGKQDVIYIPICTDLGGTPGDNEVFTGIKSGCEIYCHPSLETNNNGSEDGDLAFARSQGAVIVFIQSFEGPEEITDLTASTVTMTEIDLIFTAPTSVNGLKFYELYLDGNYYGRYLPGDPMKITGLTYETTHEVNIITTDNYFNKGGSNVLTVTTASPPQTSVPTNGLVSYYKAESADAVLIDDFGDFDAVNNGMTLTTGKKGSALLNATGNLKIPANNMRSAIFWINVVENPPTPYYLIDMRTGRTAYIYQAGTAGFSKMYVNAQSTTINVSNIPAGWSLIYLEVSTAYTGEFTLMSRYTNNEALQGTIDEIALYNRPLTPEEITTLYNGGFGADL